MSFEDRLAEHLRASGDAIQPPPAGVQTLRTGQRTKTWGMVTIAGLGVTALGVIAVIALVPGNEPDRPTPGEDQPSRFVVSPFVEVESRLNAQADVELFTVTTREPHYWRIATLHHYEDDIWKLNADFEQTGGERFSSIGSVDNPPVSLYVSITGLDTIWLPATAEPFQITLDDRHQTDQAASNRELLGDPEIEFDAVGGSLAVDLDYPSSKGLAYTVQSASVVATPEVLRDAPNSVPPAIASWYLGGDDEVYPQLLSERAALVTTGSETRYDNVLAIQNHLRDFAYEDDPVASTNDPIVRLLEEQTGSAPQFASAFVMMARQLGIPSRVAVGFTWGEPISIEGGMITYAVSERHAHAWPEVYFDTVGWVPFEPTPGRGIPGAVVYTGVVAEQVN